MVRRGHNYWCSFSKRPSLGSRMQVSGSGSVTIQSINAHVDGNYAKATSLKDPDVSAFHTMLSFFHPLLLGILDWHLCPTSQENARCYDHQL